MSEIVISRHIANVIKEGELEKSNMQKKHIANSDKPVSDYSLVVGWNSVAFSGIVGYSAVLVYCLWWKTLRYSTLRAELLRSD